MKRQCAVHKLGVVPYDQAWRLQERLAAEIAHGKKGATLLLLEHRHTYTFGRTGEPTNLLWNVEELDRQGVRVHWVDRGGDVTYHGPGQLVGYPLIKLGSGGLVQKNRAVDKGKSRVRIPRADYVGYIRNLEKCLITALAKLGLVSGQMKGMSGVWVQPHVASRCSKCPPELREKPSKIAAIGVKVDVNGVTRHGFALNVNPDMSYWQGIIACGLEGYPSSSLEELLDPAPDMEEVMSAVVDSFGYLFDYDMAEGPLERL